MISVAKVCSTEFSGVSSSISLMRVWVLPGAYPVSDNELIDLRLKVGGEMYFRALQGDRKPAVRQHRNVKYISLLKLTDDVLRPATRR